MHRTSSASSLVTAAAATAAATAATATAVTAASTATAATTTAIFAWASFVDGKRAAIVLSAIHTSNGRLGLFITSHFDKAEAFASTGVAVHDDFGTLHGAERTKNLIQI
jgi:hypothetical protein